LRKCIGATIAMMALGHSMASAAYAAEASVNDLDPIEVIGSSEYDVGNGYSGMDLDAFDVGSDDGSGGSEGGGEEDTICPTLIQRKPPSCYGPNEVKGGDWGKNLYPFSSGLHQLISVIHPSSDTTENSAITNLELGTRGILSAALDRHTQDVASLTVAFDEANARLLESALEGCNRQQAIWGDAGGCFMILRVLAREHFGQTDGLRDFLSGIDGLLRPIVDFFVPENSLRIKYDSAREQVRCNAWHKEVENNGCK
jgi:hypothetical protein